MLTGLKNDFPLYARKLLKIVDKSGQLVPFELNAQQLHIHEIARKQLEETGMVRIIVLKSRKLGLSTYVGGRYMWRTMFNKHRRAGVMTHLGDSTTALFRVYKRFYDNIHAGLRPGLRKNNAKELDFLGLDSSLKVATAGSAEVGRGDTLNYMHLSEMAFYPNAKEITAGYMQSVGEVEGSEIFIESTPNGLNAFYEWWVEAEAGRNGFIPVFFGWDWDPDCTRKPEADFKLTDEEKNYATLHNLSLEQSCWRRFKISTMGELKFRQEYPLTVAEAWRATDSEGFIPSDLVLAARKRTVPVETNMPLILGVDVAHMGKDKTCIAWRRGNTILKYELLEKKNNEQIAERVIQIMQAERPTKVFIDGTGGYGAGVISVMRLRGYEAEAIHFAESPSDPQYANKRAEMYGELREWLKGEVSLPDDDSLEQDIVAPNYKHNIQNRLLLEPKGDIVKRLKRSPDRADAIALCFAYRIGPNLTAGNSAIWDDIKNREAIYDW